MLFGYYFLTIIKPGVGGYSVRKRCTRSCRHIVTVEWDCGHYHTTHYAAHTATLHLTITLRDAVDTKKVEGPGLLTLYEITCLNNYYTQVYLLHYTSSLHQCGYTTVWLTLFCLFGGLVNITFRT